MPDPEPQAWCGYCGQPLPPEEEPEPGAFDGDHLIEVETDWFGPGVPHEYPPPEPVVNYGARWTRRSDGEVLHACGVFAENPEHSVPPPVPLAPNPSPNDHL